jgi:DNA-binding transcriptional LysR family regulator
MAKLDVDWLNVFVEIYKTQSVSRAADRLGMAQANASIALNKLRRYFGDRLFSRTSRGMEPTPYTQQIYPEVLATVERLAKLTGPRASFDPAAVRRQFRICMT